MSPLAPARRGGLRLAPRKAEGVVVSAADQTDYKLTKKRWTKTFCKWAAGYEFGQPADTFAFRVKLNAVLRLEERLCEVEAEILHIIGSNPKLAARMARFTCIYGIGKVAAFSLVCEVYGFERFCNGASFASFVGLVPSKSSSGKKVVRGAIAKQGNSHLRRILVEAAGYYSKPFKIVRSEDTSVLEAVRAKAEKCANRLKKRRAALGRRNLSPNKAKVAVARELAEWIYWIAVLPT